MGAKRKTERKLTYEWTDERIATLIWMWNTDRTASEIAERIGSTKNAVIGKARRLKLKPRTWNPNNIVFQEWTPKRLKWLAELFEEGNSHQRITEIMGHTSKSSVANQLAKMGLKRDRSALKFHGQKTKPTPVVVMRPQARVFGETVVKPFIIAGGGRMAFAAAPDRPSPVKGDLAAWAPLEGVEPVPFMERERWMCKWPVGLATGAEMLCCGAPRQVERPYCPHHQQLSRAPEQPKDLGKLERSHRRMLGRHAA